jgi:hypothetical protein
MPLTPPPSTAVTFADKTLTGNTSVADSFSLEGDITPTILSANQNNYSPTSLSTSSIVYLTSDASRGITGLATGKDGRVVILFNSGSNDIVLVNNSASSTAANRFTLPEDADVTLTAKKGVVLVYDTPSSRWRTVNPLSKAVATTLRTGTDDERYMTIKSMYDALAEVTLTDANTIAVPMGNGVNFAVTLGGNRTLGNPTGVKSGQSGRIRLIQNGSGNNTLSFDTNWKRVNGAPTLTTTASAIDILEYDAISNTYILYDVLKNPS